MKIWQQYKDYLFSGEWHIHTSFTDGKNTILEYAEAADELKIPLLAFTEHVRKNLDYSYDDFIKEINDAQKKFPNVILLSGIEAKVLPHGSLDCSANVFQMADYKLFAFHSFPENLEIYVTSIEKIIKHYSVDAWAHPGLFFKKYKNLKLSDEQLGHIFELMNNYNILLEINFRYNLPSINWIRRYLKISNNSNIIFGTDAHNIDDLQRAWKIKEEFKTYHKKISSDKINITSFLNWFIEKYPGDLKE